MDPILCPQCGHNNQPSAAQCQACGTSLAYVSPPMVAGLAGDDREGMGDDAALRMLLPVGRSIWAIAAGYLGLLAVCSGVTGPPALICGILAIREIRRNPKKHGMGRAIFGIVMGILGTLLLLAILGSLVFRALVRGM